MFCWPGPHSVYAWGERDPVDYYLQEQLTKRDAELVPSLFYSRALLFWDKGLRAIYWPSTAGRVP